MINKKTHYRHIHGLDGLRALAVIFVIAYHYGFEWASGGFLGVDIFFVLSGYLITSALLAYQQEKQSFNLAHFWIGRMRRLLPAAYLMVMTVVAWAVLFDQALLTTLRGDALSSIFYTSNWWFIFHEVSYFDSFNSPSPLKNLWSLAIEEQFYILWPILFFIGLRFIKKRSMLSLLVFVGAIVSVGLMAFLYEPGSDPSRVYYGTDTRSFELLIGCWLALVWPMKRLSSKNLPPFGKAILDLTSLTSLLMVMLCVMFLNEYQSSLYRGGMLLVCLNAAILVATVCHPSCSVGRLLSFKPLRWVGTRSYGIYLWHYPILVLTTPVAEISHPVYAHVGLQVAAILIIAELSYRFVEMPIRKHGFRHYFQAYKPKRILQWGNLPRISKVAMPCSLVLLILFTTGMTPLAVPDQKQDEEKREVTQLKTSHKEIPSQDAKEAFNQQPSGNDSQEKNQTKEPLYEEVLSIGDSVMLNIAPYLQQTYAQVTIDAKVGRQLSEAVQLASNYAQLNKPTSAIIIQLGTNGYFTKEQLNHLLSAFSKSDIYLVNTRVPRKWENEVNKLLKDAAAKRENVTLVDWYSTAIEHPEYFTKDGVHLVPEGAKKLTALIDAAIQKKNHR
ncbi:acetyltransferase [Priestia megaterium]|nr:acetyltransferase [Priestia megaterium]